MKEFIKAFGILIKAYFKFIIAIIRLNCTRIRLQIKKYIVFPIKLKAYTLLIKASTKFREREVDKILKEFEYAYNSDN